jgi:dTDP-4-dehydrorhamnose reductase
MGLKTILFTGGSGLLSLNWALRLRFSCRIILILHSRHILVDGCELVYASLNDLEELDRLFTYYQPDVVIHTAAITDVEKCEQYPEQAKIVNVDFSATIANCCFKHKCKLVYISTDHLFDGKDKFMKEIDEVTPLNVYAKTKSDAESVVLYQCPDALVIRTNFFGWGPKYRVSFSDWFINSLSQGKIINLFKDVYFTPIYIPELIRAVMELVDRNFNGIFNVVSSERVSKYEFGYTLAKIFGFDSSLIKSSSIIMFSSLVKRPLDMSLSNSKVNNRLTVPIDLLEKQIYQLKVDKNSIYSLSIKNL